MRDSAAAARAGLAAAAAGGDLRRRPAGRPGPRRAHPDAGVRQRARSAADDLPALRRVRHRLQRRGEEHPRPHLPVGGGPPRRRPAHPPRGPRLRAAAAAAATRSATSCTTRPTRAGRPGPAPSRCTASPATGWCSAAGTFGSTYLLLRNRGGVPGDEPHPGHPVLRQRRPAVLPARRLGPQRTRRPPAHRGQPGHGDHQRDPGRRRARRRRRDRPRLLRRRTPATRCSPTGWSRAPSCPGRSAGWPRFAAQPAARGGSAGRRRPASPPTSAR